MFRSSEVPIRPLLVREADPLVTPVGLLDTTPVDRVFDPKDPVCTDPVSASVANVLLVLLRRFPPPLPPPPSAKAVEAICCDLRA